MIPAFVFTERMLEYDYGIHHPLQVSRLRLARDLMKAYGMLEDAETLLDVPQSAEKGDLLRFHTEKYIGILEKANAGVKFRGLEFYGIGTGDNPVFEGLYDWSRLVVGASLNAARLVADEATNIAFSIGGGLHHGRKDRASGFCYVNDPVLVILYLADRGYRVAYVDVDAHHGDGVQWAFYDTDRVLTISLHQDGRTLFPGTGGVEEVGRDAGLGYSVNVPLWPGTDDWLYLRAFDEVVEPLILRFQPDILVSQLGVDTFHGDPLASLDLTTQGFVRIVEKLKRLCAKWVALGGGGYELLNVARAWTLAWGVMRDHIPEDRIPHDFMETMRRFGYHQETLQDDYLWPTLRREAAEEALDTVLQRVRRNIFPLHGL